YQRATQLRISLQLAIGVGDLVVHIHGQGVVFLRPVQGDQQNMTISHDGYIRHKTSLALPGFYTAKHPVGTRLSLCGTATRMSRRPRRHMDVPSWPAEQRLNRVRELTSSTI